MKMHQQDKDFLDLYVEKYDDVEGLLLLDFVSRTEASSFLKYYEVFSKNSNSFSPSMLLLKNVPAVNSQNFREGNIYRMSKDFFVSLKWTKPEEISFVALIADLRTEGTHKFKEFLASKTHVPFASVKIPSYFTQNNSTIQNLEYGKIDFLSPTEDSYGHMPIWSKSIPDRLIVRNVGQGNWNQIMSNEKCILNFDYGCSLY